MIITVLGSIAHSARALSTQARLKRFFPVFSKTLEQNAVSYNRYPRLSSFTVCLSLFLLLPLTLFVERSLHVSPYSPHQPKSLSLFFAFFSLSPWKSIDMRVLYVRTFDYIQLFKDEKKFLFYVLVVVFCDFLLLR